MADNGNYGWNGNGLAASQQDILFSNVRILDATGEMPYSGEVTISGNRIKSVNRTDSNSYSWGNGGGIRIDGRGMTLMPGLIDAHLHLSWNNAAGIAPIQMMPVEEHVINCVVMARVLLDAGFTAGCGAAAAKPRLDVVIRDAINAGQCLGPRYLAAG